MKAMMRTRRRKGVSIVELLIGLTLAGIIGLALVKTFISQVRFSDTQYKMRSARTAARSPLNLMLSEMRMVETGNGIAAASSAPGASFVSLRVPVTMGIVCGSSGIATVVSLLPVDSLVLASASLSGSAYRASDGSYSYAEGPTVVTAGGAAICAASSVTTVAGGRVVLVTPALAADAVAGTPAFLYQRVRYALKASAAMPGRTGLWRTIEATNASEELTSPVDAVSRFRFYRLGNDTSDAVVPLLNEITGIELILVGASEKGRFGRTVPEQSPLRTAVFFVNRND
jgi:Tfp pilus assembly protein PilW